MTGSIRLSAEAEAKIQELRSRYPQSNSAVMPALYIAQGELGWISEEAVAWVSARLDMPPSHILEVSTFYTMYYKKPVGQYHIQLCRTLSCMICGARELAAYITKRIGVPAHSITPCGTWSYEEVECLGSCGTAPMIQINDRFFENLTVESLGNLMDEIEREKPKLRYSNISESIDLDLKNHPISQILN